MSYRMVDRPKLIAEINLDGQTLVTGVSVVPKLAVANLLTNGGFETGNTTGWTATGNCGVETAASYGVTSGTTTYHFQFNGGSLTPNGVLYQTFSATAGVPIKLQFDWGNFGSGTATLLVEVLSPDTTVLYSSTLVDSTGLTTYLLYQHFSQVITPSQTGTHTLRFTDQTGGGAEVLDPLIDNVCIYANPLSQLRGYLTEDNNVFTCLMPGLYCLQLNYTALGGGNVIYPQLLRNGSIEHTLAPGNFGTSTGTQKTATVMVLASTGDTFQLALQGASNSIIYSTGEASTKLRVFFLGSNIGVDPIQASRYKMVAGLSSLTGLVAYTRSQLRVDSPSVNSANFTYSSYTFTCTIPGIYSIYIRGYFAYGSYFLAANKNGAWRIETAFGNYHKTGFGLIDLAVGDTLDFYCYSEGVSAESFPNFAFEACLL